jgi:hypothetical protein
MASTKSRQVIWSGRIKLAKSQAEHARKRAVEATRDADRAEAKAWSVRMEGFGGPAQPSPTIGQCLNGGLGWLEVECNRCETKASIPLDAIRRPRDTPLWKLEASLKMPVMSQRPLRTTGSHDPADCNQGDHALQVGAPR